MNRDFVLLYVNGQRREVRGPAAFLPLANYLRYEQRLTGTKIVCAEGDCGACTVLRGTVLEGEANSRLSFQVINSCIAPTYGMDGSHIVTVEGLLERGKISAVQASMIQHQGGQCGFCTPGMVMAITGMLEEHEQVDTQKVKNHLTGNLCRCTGYTPIIEAALGVDQAAHQRIADRYHDGGIIEDLREHARRPIHLRSGDRSLHAPTELSDVSSLLKEDSELRIMAAATDVGVQINKGRVDPKRIVSLHLVAELYRIETTPNLLRVGARATLAQIETATDKTLPVFADFLHIFASPQIKNAATLVGNIANGSPIADTLPFLFAVEARIGIVGPKGRRALPIRDLYRGYKQLALEAGEWIATVDIPLIPNRKYRLYKVSQRRDLDISCVNAAFCWQQDGDAVTDLRIAYGGVGPTTLRMTKCEQALTGQQLQNVPLVDAAKLLLSEMTPLGDVRGSQAYRERIATNLLRRFVDEAVADRGAP